MLLKQNTLRLLGIKFSLLLSKYEPSIRLFTTVMQNFILHIELVSCADSSSREALHYTY